MQRKGLEKRPLDSSRLNCAIPKFQDWMVADFLSICQFCERKTPNENVISCGTCFHLESGIWNPNIQGLNLVINQVDPTGSSHSHQGSISKNFFD